MEEKMKFPTKRKEIKQEIFDYLEVPEEKKKVLTNKFEYASIVNKSGITATKYNAKNQC